MSSRTTIFGLSLLVFLFKIPACGSPLTPPTPEAYSLNVNPADFVAEIDNPYMPLIPGTTYIYEGVTEEGNEHNEVYVSHETKEIMGVTCVVVQDIVMVDGQVREITLDWFAQDKQGNVWYFGEDTREYKDGWVTSTKGSWEAGVDGALPGIIMKAQPSINDTYRQEYSKGAAEDWAAIRSLSEISFVPTGYYGDLLLITEWSGLDNPPVYQQKYYAKGVGFVKAKSLDSNYELKLIDVHYEP
jgi:hypothetical protein